MKTLAEIFKNKPELLEVAEVKELIKLSTEQYDLMINMYKPYFKKNDEIMHLIFESEVVVINGESSKSVVEKILREFI